jgi:hypothetical protein
VTSPEKIAYPFKENIKQQDWEPTYSTIIKEDLQAIPGLSTLFKNTLKKEAATKGAIIQPFGFNQNKFTYAAIAACLMVFLGYQQLTKTEMLPSEASPLVETKISNASPKVSIEKIETLASTKQVPTKPKALVKLQVSNTSKTERIDVIQEESIAMAEPASNNGNFNNQVVITKLPSTYNNPITINTIAIAKKSIEIEITSEENGPVSYEVIDTEDPDRTILIANFEIDGNKLRGLKRKIGSLFKNNNRIENNNK